ncbi:MAG: dihydroorotate oxidase [Candidatus Woesearchaeota archaeon]
MSYTNTMISGVPLESYVMNASGPKDTNLDELKDIARSASSAIVMKSATIDYRKGNPEPRYAALPLGSLQSMGLPNLGYKAYIGIADKLKAYGKPIIASVAGSNIEEYIVMVKEFRDSSVSMIELNMSCPNIEGKSVIGYDTGLVERIIGEVHDIGDKPIGIKLPPYYDDVQFESLSRIVIDYGIGFITCINSVPNALYIDPVSESTVIRPKRGFGGLGGSYIKPIALGNVRRFYELLEGKACIIGVGGIESGTDAFEYLIAGADAVQVGTAFDKHGTRVFSDINNELTSILKDKHYSNIGQAKGRLKVI